VLFIVSLNLTELIRPTINKREMTMRTPNIIIAVSLGTALSLVPMRAESQTSVKSSQPIGRLARAVELQERAIALHAQPTRAAEAARLHKWSASLRDADDPEAVRSLAMAAHLFGYANRPFDARVTMEEAAERALAMGDVVKAAQSYVEATFFAQKQKKQSEIERLGRKALLLAASPLLAAEQRTAIMQRIRSNPSLAGLVK
jgi:hypothetical protein